MEDELSHKHTARKKRNWVWIKILAILGVLTEAILVINHVNVGSFVHIIGIIAVILVALISIFFILQEHFEEKGSALKLSRKVVIISLIIVLIIGWFFVRPTYFHHRCAKKSWELVNDTANKDYLSVDDARKLYDLRYKDCNNYWGL